MMGRTLGDQGVNGWNAGGANNLMSIKGLSLGIYPNHIFENIPRLYLVFILGILFPVSTLRWLAELVEEVWMLLEMC